MIGVHLFRRLSPRVCISVIVCQGPPTCTVPNLDRSLHHSPALPVRMNITLPSIKPSPSHTLPVIVLPLAHFPFVIIRWHRGTVACQRAIGRLTLRVAKEEQSPLLLFVTSPQFFCPAPRRWCRWRWRRRWRPCTRVSTCAVSFPVHHCAGEADDWIQSAG